VYQILGLGGLGDVVGYAMIAAVSPAASNWGGVTNATPGVWRRASSTLQRLPGRCRRHLGGEHERAVEPGPEPLGEQVIGLSGGEPGGSLPASVKARRIENNGMMRISSTSSAEVP